jgi:hypothetical protein
MGDEANAPTETPTTPEQPQAPQEAAAPESGSRAAKLAAYRAAAAKPGDVVAPTEPKPAATAAPVEQPREELTDPQTAKSIEAIEKRDARARAQLAADQAAWKQQRDLELAELAKLRAELTGKTSLDDLKKLPPSRRAIEAMRMAGLDPDDEEAMEIIARDTYARSKSGKAKPENRAYADQLAKEHGTASEIAELRKMLEETRQSIEQRDHAAELKRFQNTYLDEAVKAVPQAPSFIGRALAANPAKARGALLALGQRMEREAMEADGATSYDPSYTPTHAQVIARYEEETRAELADRGFTTEQIDAMLAPAAAKPPPPKTLDVGARPTTPITSAPQSRAEKIAKARVGLQKLNAEQ